MRRNLKEVWEQVRETSKGRAPRKMEQHVKGTWVRSKVRGYRKNSKEATVAQAE